jgi:MbtH protein
MSLITNTQTDLDGWQVVINTQQQYSIWSTSKPIPNGWQVQSVPQSWLDAHLANHPDTCAKQTCLAYIGEVWQDLTPLSVHQHLQQLTATQCAANVAGHSVQTQGA